MGFFSRKHGARTSEVSPTRTLTSASDKDVEVTALKPKNYIDPKIEKRVVRKLDWHVVSFLGFLYMLSFLDRSNIGNAYVAGMRKDLNLTGQEYPWLLTIFYISYILFSFQGFMWRIFKPHQWAAFVVFGWGVVSSCQAAAQSWAGMMVLRFLLGVFEAGYSPSIPFVLSFFYTRREIGFRIGLWGCAAPIASCFAGALAYGITSGHSRLAPWRLLFLVEGLPTVIAAFLAYFFLPDNQAQARFLTEEERAVARLRIEKQHGRAEVDKIQGGFNLKEIGATLLDPIAWCICLMYFSCNVSFAAIPVFLPLIIQQMGFTSIDAQGLSAPPFFLAIFTVLLTTYLADKTQQRGYTISVTSLIGGVGFILLATTTSIATRYVGVFLAVNGAFCATANLFPWLVNNQGSTSRRGMAVVILNVIGQCGPILGTRMYPMNEAPRFVKGQYVCAGFMFFNSVVSVMGRWYMAYRNKKLDEVYGVRVERGENAGVEDDGDENYGRNFRFAL